MNSFRGIWLVVQIAFVLIFPLSMVSAAEQYDARIMKLDTEAARLWGLGQFGEALRLAREAAQLGEQLYGADDHRVGELIAKVSLILKRMGSPETETEFRRALAIWESDATRTEKEKGADHPDTATALRRIGGLFFAHNRYAEAEPPLQRALAIREKVLGAEHPDLGEFLYRLGGISWAQRRIEEAEQHYKRGLAIQEKAKGPDSPELGEWLDILGRFYIARRRADEVEPLLLRQLAIVEKAPGPEHRDVAKVLFTLAGVYDFQDPEQAAKAENIYQRGLAIVQKAKGPDDIELREWYDQLGKIAHQRQRSARSGQAWPADHHPPACIRYDVDARNYRRGSRCLAGLRRRYEIADAHAVLRRPHHDRQGGAGKARATDARGGHAGGSLHRDSAPHGADLPTEAPLRSYFTRLARKVM